MRIAIVSGSSGLIGAESCRFFAKQGMHVVGIDNDMRRYFFGEQASTEWSQARLHADLGNSFTHYSADIRDADAIGKIFAEYSSDISLVIHTAAQPSHDWAAK